MKDGSQQKKIVGVPRPLFSLLLVLSIMALGINVLGGGWLGYYWKAHRSEKYLQSQIDHAAVAKACALLITQLGTNEEASFTGTDSALPEAIRRLESSSVFAFTNQVKISFGGGFHHWGLFYSDGLEPVKIGPSLEFWTDGRDSKKLWP